MTTRRPTLSALRGALPLLLLCWGCGAEGQAPNAAASADPNAAAVVDACTAFSADLFIPVVGGPVSTSGHTEQLTGAWNSTCLIQGSRGSLILSYNGSFTLARSTSELLASVTEWIERRRSGRFAESLTDAEPVEEFGAPAVHYYDDTAGMHVFVVQHRAYRVEVGAPDRGVARQATRIALEHAP